MHAKRERERIGKRVTGEGGNTGWGGWKESDLGWGWGVGDTGGE